jgi:hypothetical protein
MPSLAATAPQPALTPTPPSLPVGIVIPRIGVDTKLDQLAVPPNGQPPAPPQWMVPVWYTASPIPGQPGPAVIAGHLDSYTGPAIFWHLGQLRPGDQVVIERADAAPLTFIVYKVEAVSQSNFPSQEVYGPTPFPELRLITCTGTWSSALQRYSQNIVVFARLEGT